MADQLKILTICGSLRKGSHNAAVVATLPALAPAGLTFLPSPSFAEFPIYNVDIQTAGVPAAVTAFADAIRAADGVIIVSPEYNWSIPGGLKNAIDWVSKLKDVPFKDKPVALQSASGGQVGGARMQYHLRMALQSIDALLLSKPEVFINFAAKKVDESAGLLTDEPAKDIVKQQLAAFAKFVARVKV